MTDRQILINAFAMNCPTHLVAGTWKHPESQAWRYKDLRYWTELAQLLERARFDGLFIADVIGVYDVYGGAPDAALRAGAQIPAGDPMMLVSAMAYVTEHLGFGITASTSYEHPYTFARRMSTLDHLTAGRVGWNIVTSYLNSGALNVGFDGQVSHDDRYDIADEYLEVTYKLWEGSWEDDAVVIDREVGVYTDPARVHPIAHEGRYYRVAGIHMAEPSPHARHCCSRPAPRRGGGGSPPSMPRRCSVPSPRPRSSRGGSPTSVSAPSPPDGGQRTSRCSPDLGSSPGRRGARRGASTTSIAA